MNERATQPSKDELTEYEAVSRAQEGDPIGFEYLYQRNSKKVYSVCLRMLKNAADAEDMTQQVFLQLFRAIRNFRKEARFSTWVYRVTLNAVLMHLRRKKGVEVQPAGEVSIEAQIDARSESAGRNTSHAIDRLSLKRAINRLPEGYRRFFLLHDVLGYEHQEIAKLVGCSIGCSKSQAHKARRRLQQLLCGEYL